jgi:hypothetical protein
VFVSATSFRAVMPMSASLIQRHDDWLDPSVRRYGMRAKCARWSHVVPDVFLQTCCCTGARRPRATRCRREDLKPHPAPLRRQDADTESGEPRGPFRPISQISKPQPFFHSQPSQQTSRLADYRHPAVLTMTSKHIDPTKLGTFAGAAAGQ